MQRKREKRQVGPISTKGQTAFPELPKGPNGPFLAKRPFGPLKRPFHMKRPFHVSPAKFPSSPPSERNRITFPRRLILQYVVVLDLVPI